ncbi:MAG TPA: tetratricopeptide repeat protein [Stellaceae bacterium]|nr:tetratricopeptide repeat protein [Stellaceae bacterium]
MMRRDIGIAAAAVMFLAAPHIGVGVVPSAQGDASAVLARSLSTTERRLGPGAPELLPILGRLARLRFEQAEFAEATALRHRSLKIAIAAYGNASVPAAEAMTALARLYIERRRYLDAEPLAIAATGILRDRLAPSDPALTSVMVDRARISLARGDDADARKWAEAAVGLDEKNHSLDEKTHGLDEKSHDAPRSDGLRVLGAVLTAEGKFEQSERVLRQALARDRATGDKLATARSLAQLGNTYLRQKRFAEALPPIEEAAWIDQGHLAAAHPLIAEDFRDLGLIYLATNRPGDAQKALHTAIDILERGAGRDTPTRGYIELDLARAEHALGHEDKARSLFNDARRILNAAEDEERDRQRQASARFCALPVV